MTSIITPNEVVASGEIANSSAQARSTLGRLTPNAGVQRGARVVINRARDLASQGNDPWNNTLRQMLVDQHALYETWKPVAELLNRSNQAIRSEWNKMRSGQRENEGNWQEKVEVCEMRRKITFSSGSGTRDTSTAPDSAHTPPTDSVYEGALLLIAAAKSIKIKVPSSGGHGGVTGREKGPLRVKSPDFDKRYPRYMPPTGLSERQITADLHNMGICRRPKMRRSALCRSRRM